VDLDSLNNEIRAEIHRLDERRAFLLEQIVHLDALEKVGSVDDANVGLLTEPPQTASGGSLLSQEDREGREEMLAALRCLKCGASLRSLVPVDDSGQPIINSRRLGKAEAGSRYLECPQCQSKNTFVRTTSPRGWRLLITQLRS